MTQQTDDLIINLLLNDKASADMLQFANTADTLKLKIEGLKLVFGRLQKELLVTAREAEQGVLAYDKFIAAADRAGMVQTPSRINQSALKAVTSGSLVPPEATVEQAQILATQEQERMRYQELQLQWEEHFRQVRISNEQQYREFVTAGQNQIAQQRIEQQQQYQTYVQQGNNATQQQRLEQQQQYQNYVLQGTTANQQQRLQQEQQYRMYLMEGTQATQQERLAQAQQYLSYVQQGNEAAAQAQIAQNQQYQQYVQQGNAANQAQRMQQQQQYQAYLLEGTAANAQAQLAQAQQYQAYLLEGNAANQAERLAQAQQYQQYVLQGNLAAARTQMEQNQQYQQWLATSRQAQTQNQLEQTRQVQERELLAQQETQTRRMVGIQTVAEAEMLADQQNLARDMAMQREMDFMRANSARLAQIQNMAPANQINPLARFFGDARAAGLDMQVITSQLQRQFGLILPQEIQKATKELGNMRNGFFNMMKEAFSLSSIMNTLFGVGMAMIVFQLTQLFTSFITSTIQQVKDLEAAISSLSATEAAMSRSGVSVTGQDLLDLVSELEKKWTNIGRTDLMKATGDLGFKLSDKGVSVKELQDLMDVILSVQVRNPSKKFNEVATMFSQATLSNNYEGVGGLGYTTSADSIQKAALEAGIISDINQKLTDQETIRAKIYQWKQKELADEKETLAMQENLSNATTKLKAAWENLAEVLSPVVDIWNELVYIAATVLSGWTSIIRVLSGSAEATTPLQKAVKYVYDISSIINKFIPVVALWNTLMWSIAKAYETISGKKISDQPSAGKLALQDTPTGTPPAIPDEAADKTEDNAKKMQKWINDVIEAMDAFIDKAKKMEEDYKIAMDKMAQDQKIARDRFMQDWGIDRAKVVDDANKAIAQKEKEYRDKQKEEEAKFQEDLRQLREKYLMSLEDALHERDARAVIRLAREYAMNKQNMINEHNLSRQSASTGHQNSIAQMAKERDDRLRQLDAERALEWARKEEDYKLKVTRAEEEHVLEMKRLEEEKQDKLRQLGQSFAEQFGLNSIGSKKIYDLLDSYFGQGKGVDKMMKWTYDNVVAYAAAMATQLTAIYDQYKATAAAIGTYNPGTSPVAPKPTPVLVPSIGAVAGTIPPAPTFTPAGYQWIWRPSTQKWSLERLMAEGGLAVADKATSVTFGEKSKELALFLPLNRLSTLFGSASGGSNMQSNGGKMELMVTLSPDLETRIVNKSLDSMANTIMQVRKGR